MTQFLGEYSCKLDAKGRLLLPAGIKKQLEPEAQERFVMNRGFEQCLSIYPFNEWEKITAAINKLNLYVRKNRAFVRYFYRGATELLLDGNDRLLLPKSLLQYADIKREAVLFGYADRIEVWSKGRYESLLTDEPEDFASLAEEVMGNKKDTENDTDNNPEKDDTDVS